jgi:cephalosporin-C deacetylase-like acetyl esterase
MKEITLKVVCILLLLSLITSENYPYRSDYLWITVPDHRDWLYKVGEEAKIEVGFYLYGIPQDIEISYEIGPDMLPSTSSGKANLENGKAIISIGTMTRPGFLDLRLTAKIGSKTYPHHVKVGFSPELLNPYTQDPLDFDNFWKETLATARKTKLTYNIEKVDKYTTDEFDTFLLKLRTDNKHYIYGYLTKPKDASSEKKYPVVLCPPGAGIKTIKEPMRNTYYAKNGFIRLEMEIHGLHPEITADQFSEISSEFGGYIENGLDDKENAYLRHVYVACIRAMDYLTSLPEWDGKNAFVQGGSQGGALSIITAGLDKRVTACVVNHPALSDMAGYLDGRAGGYPHFNKMNKMLTPEKVEAMAYYDVVNFAMRIECPVYMTWGYNDDTCPPTTSYIVWNLITSPKKSLITPINEHWTTEETNYGQMEWLKTQIN